MPTSSPFVFINYSDPSKERKNKKHRHIITKYATLHGCKTRRKPNVGLATPPPSDDGKDEEDDVEDIERIEETALTLRPAFDASTYEAESEWLEKAYNRRDRILSLLGCAQNDPFDTLPVKPDHQMWKLLTSWLNAGNRSDAAEDGYRRQVSVIRRSWFWPMVNRNKSTFNAAVAWIAISTGDAAMQSTLATSLASSLPALRESLTSPKADTAESAWYSVVLLLAISIRTKDTEATMAHYKGLASLLSQRPDFFSDPKKQAIPFTSSFLYTFVASVILANYKDYIRSPSLNYMPDYIRSVGPRYASLDAANGRSNGFADLHTQGALSTFVRDLVTYIRPLQYLTSRARGGILTIDEATDLLSCVWCCQLGLYIPKLITTEIEELCWLGITTYWHLERSSWEAVADLSTAIYRRLVRTNTVKLQQDYPNAVFWLAMCSGSMISVLNPTPEEVEMSMALQGYVAALRRLYDIVDWDDARLILRYFLWSDVADELGLNFWLKTFAFDTTPVDELLDIQRDNNAPDFEALPCQFCRKTMCDCLQGRADCRSCPNHLRGSLWAIPPSVFGMFCGPVWVPHRTDELPELNHMHEIKRKEGGF